jgi:hypothetical protein
MLYGRLKNYKIQKLKAERRIHELKVEALKSAQVEFKSTLRVYIKTIST